MPLNKKTVINMLKYLELEKLSQTENTYLCRIIKQKYRGLDFAPFKFYNKRFFESICGVLLSSFEYPDFAKLNLSLRGAMQQKDLSTFLIPIQYWNVVQLAILEYNILMEEYEKEKQIF